MVTARIRVALARTPRVERARPTLCALRPPTVVRAFRAALALLGRVRRLVAAAPARPQVALVVAGPRPPPGRSVS